MLVASLVLFAGIRITLKAGHILIQGAPIGLTPVIIRQNLVENIVGVKDVHPVRVWQITEDRPVVTVCIKPEAGACVEPLRQSVKQYLQEDMQLHLVTVEVIGEPVGTVVSQFGPVANDGNIPPERGSKRAR